MRFRPTFAVLIALLAATGLWADVMVGDARDEVIRQHGQPSSVAKRGNREYFGYPKGGRVELTDGKVSDVKGPLPVVTTAPAPPPAEPVAAYTPPAAVTPAPAPVTATPPPKTATPPAPTPKPAPPVYDAAAATAALSAHIEKMDTPWGAAPVETKKRGPLDSIPAFVAGLLLRFALTVAALKLAFKYWEMDAFWKGILAIAGIDLGLHAILQLLGGVTSGLTSMKAVENGIPGLVLIHTINRFCFNKRLQNAVATAAAVKVGVSTLYIFAGLAMLNLAFG